MPVITCPKCGAPMHTRRRNGVTIEQCVDCHGIFLDRGELEQLIGAESSFLSADPPELDDRQLVDLGAGGQVDRGRG